MLYDFMRNVDKGDLWVAICILLPIMSFFVIAHGVGNPSKDENRALRLWSKWPNDLLGVMFTVWGFFAPSLIVLTYGGTAIDLVPILAAHALIFSIGALFENIIGKRRWDEFSAIVLTHFIICAVVITLVGLGGSL